MLSPEERRKGREEWRTTKENGILP